MKVSSPPVVLVVDDDPGMHGFLTAFLEARGYTVRAASTVDDAIHTLHSAAVDAVVLDVKMPGRSGLDLLTYLRSTARLRSLPVLILTGEPLTLEEEEVVASQRAYIFYKQKEDLEELASYVQRLTRAA